MYYTLASHHQLTGSSFVPRSCFSSFVLSLHTLF
jgi:hypothetical protein